MIFSLAACGGKDVNLQEETGQDTLPGTDIKRTSSMELRYADQFTVDYYEGGYKLIQVTGGRSYLIVPEGMEAPEGADGKLIAVKQPLKNIYVAATASMALFDSIDGLGSISLSSQRAGDWYVPNAVQAMKEGRIHFAGKYSEPDFETLLECNCDLAVESTMILHNPTVQEMLERLGIPVFIEQSSYESHPLGRTEWVKAYGALLNKEEEAESYFESQAAIAEELEGLENTGKTAAMFFINTSGGVVVYSSGSYIIKMLELAGGNYVFENTGNKDSSKSSVNITMEEFYSAAVDADYLIYNSTVVTDEETVESLCAKCPLLKDFKAVKEGKVWCTGKQMYQATDKTGDIIKDMRIIFTDSQESPSILYKMQEK